MVSDLRGCASVETRRTPKLADNTSARRVTAISVLDAKDKTVKVSLHNSIHRLFTTTNSCIPVTAGESNTCKRRKIQWYKEQDLCRSPCVKFMETAGEQPLSGCWNQCEFFVLLGILRYICGGNQCNTEILGKSNDISGVYDAVLEVIKKGQIQQSLSAKSATQIQG